MLAALLNSSHQDDEELSASAYRVHVEESGLGRLALQKDFGHDVY